MKLSKDFDVWIEDIRHTFEDLENPEKRAQMEAYMKHKFSFFGVPAPERKVVLKEAVLSLGTKDTFTNAAHLCYMQKEREFHYLGMELLYRSRSTWDQDIYETLLSFVCNHSWWDTVDFLASNCFGHYFRMNPECVEEYVPILVSSDNMWLRRTSLLFQLKYKDQVNTDILDLAIRSMVHEDEFFIRKAIGWSLRQYAKFNPNWVLEIVDKYPLKPLSKREALKNIS